MKKEKKMLKPNYKIIDDLKVLLQKKNDQLKIAQKEWLEFKKEYDKIKNARTRMCSDYGLAKSLGRVECMKTSIKEIESVLGSRI